MQTLSTAQSPQICNEIGISDIKAESTQTWRTIHEISKLSYAIGSADWIPKPMGLNHCALWPSVSSYLPGGRQNPEYEPDCEWKTHVLEIPTTTQSLLGRIVSLSHQVGATSCLARDFSISLVFGLQGCGITFVGALLGIYTGPLAFKTSFLQLRMWFECPACFMWVLKPTSGPHTGEAGTYHWSQSLVSHKKHVRNASRMTLGQHLFRDGQDYSLPWKKKERQKKERLES